ncbi:MAG: Spy/CpxP family protein refolding chaperone [Proteobacteria bacterium]|nr:Spy/CpxP family protein refolding chaperone [Pseudomonadota bacterium]
MRVRRLFLAVPTALVAAAGLAWLTSAAASNGGIDGAPQIAQATPPAATPPAAGGPERGPGPERMMPKFSPKSFCEERIARRVGARAYLKERLDLKADQMSAWDAFQKAADAATAKEKARCAALPTEMPKTPPSLADRVNRREERMKSRLESIASVKPTLLALYDKLTPEQREVLDRPMMGRHRGGPGKHWRRG